jgi:hypothetical protein
MKHPLLLLLIVTFSFSVSAQIFKSDDLVEVDPLLSESKAGTWKKASVENVDTIGKKYIVKLDNGDKITIPSKDPEKWIRPQANPIAKLGPSRQIRYENRSNLIKAFSCRPSETYIKRNVKAQLAGFYKDYSDIYVDFTSFKGQKGYDDKKVKNQQVYPYKIEMRVYLKRTLTMGGKIFSEYQTWEFDRVYEYATRPGKKCEFSVVPDSNGKMLSTGWFVHE